MVIPVHDQNPVRRTPWVTYLLIAVNFAVFLFLEPVDKSPLANSSSPSQVCQQSAFFDRWAAIPKEMLTDHQLGEVPNGQVVAVQPGAVDCAVTPPSYHKNPVLSVLFAMFLHGGWLHILGNMLFLWVFGNNIEDRMGRVRYLLFYLVGGYLAAYGFAASDASSTTTLIGASGAIAGVLGAYLVLYPRAKVTSLVPFLFFLPLRLPAWLVLGFWFLLQWWYSVGTGAVAQGAGVAYLAHVVGFVFGAVVALLFYRRRTPPAAAAPRWVAPAPPAG